MRGPSARRAVTILGLGLVLFALSIFFEPRKTSLSCKTVSSCLGLNNRHFSTHDYLQGEFIASETTLNDDSVLYEHYELGADRDILFLVLTRDASSWSKDFRSQQRNVHDLSDVLLSTKLHLGRASLALLTSDSEEYARLVQAAQRFPPGRVLVLYKPDTSDNNIPYEQRHDPTVQLRRRSAIAALRNYLMLHALGNEKHIIWLDADVVELSPGIVQTMLMHSLSNSNAGILTARCQQHLMDNYDKNAWKVSSPQLLDVVGDADRAAAVRDLVAQRLDVPTLLNGTGSDDLVQLDSVGGTILYIRASLVRQGVVFPTFNVVGTTWSQAGWIGVETEGICYVARHLDGGGCYVLGGKHFVRHADLG